MDIFLQTLSRALEAKSFIKLTLSKSRHAAAARNLYVRRVQLKVGERLSFLWRYAQNDITKNYPLEQGLEFLRQALAKDFSQAQLFCSDGDYLYREGKKLKKLPPSLKAEQVEQSHNRQKQYLIAEDRPFLQELGISSSQGRVYAPQRDKFKQINKFVEIMQHLLKESFGSEQQALSIADMACGKGYLSFALYEYLQASEYKDTQLVGWELRPALVQQCNTLAQKLQFSGLRFEAGDIATYKAPKLDVLIALHACDTASDLALAKGIEAQAQLIVIAPCCHKQVRRDWAMAKGSPLEAISKHGILAERQAELLTDALRALILEEQGYESKVFEFISPEHSSKNLMIAAVKRKKPQDAKELAKKREALKALFGLEEQCLESLLRYASGVADIS